MTLDAEHPELKSEQRYIDHAYACMDRMLDDVRPLSNPGIDIHERESFERWKQARISSLSDTRSTLVFGRVDTDERDTYYVGRTHIRNERYDEVVLDWRAPAATRFYQAGPGNAMGLQRRRHFLTEGRELIGIADDHLDAAGRRAPDILEAELARRHGAQMGDIVATIQAEQDVVIRSPLEGLLVVQGGPGTGKTAVALHRAAYLLYEHRSFLERQEILVVGPNPVFMQYISQVLPSLGEWALTQVSVDDLAPSIRAIQPEGRDTTRLKGDIRMSVVLRRALTERRGRLTDDISLEVDRVRFVVPAADANAITQELAGREAPYSAGRELLRERLLEHAVRAYEAAVPEGRLSVEFAESTKSIRSQPAFTKALGRLWPSITSERLVAELYASPARLTLATDDLLTDAERRLLRRPRKSGWTAADRPLLDEATALIDGPPVRYGHVIVDEAQDLAPMQLRMVGRRSQQGSMTVVGDLAQASGVWGHGDWKEVVEHLPTMKAVRVEELTVGYRLCPRIADVAAAILREAAPGLRPPQSARREPGEVHRQRVPADTLPALAVETASDIADHHGSTALIAPESLADECEAALAAAGTEFARAERAGLHERLTVVGVRGCKGLEFDAVVLVEPSAIVDQEGPHLLYVAVTRAMRSLTLVHATDLPAAMREAVHAE